MNIMHKLGLFSILMSATAAAYAQPSSSPGGGIVWAAVAGAVVGFAAGYYVGKSSSNQDK